MGTKELLLPSKILEICPLKIFVLAKIYFERHIEELVRRKGA